jgi:hypothetical protein
MKVQDKLDPVRGAFENGRFPLVPTRDQLDKMSRATQKLIDSEQAVHPLRAGDTAPSSPFRTRMARA